MSGEELKAAHGLTEEDRIRHDERKKIIAQGCIHSRKAAEQDGNGNRADIAQWQRDQSEWFDPTICEIVSEYAAWRDAHPLPEQPKEGVRELLKRCQEELRLIRSKDTNAVYDIGLRSDLHAALAPSPPSTETKESGE